MPPSFRQVDIALPWPDPVVPSYKLSRVGKWSLERTPPLAGALGYWAPVVNVGAGYTLRKKHKGKQRIWMSLAPMELQSHQPHIAAARGNVMVAGLGMGFYLYNILRKEEVTNVLVIEKDPDVIKMFERVSGWHVWAGAEKLTIRKGGIFEVGHGKSFTKIDYLYLDIWEGLGTEMAYVQAQTIISQLRPTAAGYWGQEFDYVTFLGKGKLPIDLGKDMAQYRAFKEFSGMPLCGEEWELYPRLACAAVAFQAYGAAAKEGDEKAANDLYLRAADLLGVFGR